MIDHRALLKEYRALLKEYKALLTAAYRALLKEYRALLTEYTALLTNQRADTSALQEFRRLGPVVAFAEVLRDRS